MKQHCYSLNSTLAPAMFTIARYNVILISSVYKYITWEKYSTKYANKGKHLALVLIVQGKLVTMNLFCYVCRLSVLWRRCRTVSASTLRARRTLTSPPRICSPAAKSAVWGEYSLVIHKDSPSPRLLSVSWWRHQMETFSALLAICAGNSLVTGEFPTQRPVTRSFDILFDLRLNKRLSKQSWGWWFETPSCSLWRHCNGLGDNALCELWLHRRGRWLISNNESMVDDKGMQLYMIRDSRGGQMRIYARQW